MNDEVKIALKNAITMSLPILQPLTVQYTEPHLVWSRDGEQRWHGEYKDQPSFLSIFSASSKPLEEIGSEFLQLFRSHYPRFGGLLGLASLGLTNIVNDPSYILGNALIELWDRYGTFECGDDAVEAIVQEFAEFVDSPTLRIRFEAQLLNYKMKRQKIEFAGNMTIRQLTEKEVSEIYGGSIRLLIRLIPKPTIGIHDFVLEGEFEEPKIFGDQPLSESLATSTVRPNLDKAILALRTFKEGRIGYDYVRFKPIKYCPLPLTAMGYGDLYVPLGEYNVSDEEIEPLQRHARLIYSKLDPAMELACSRLSDAQTRLHARDRLVDAVIGLEALLLAGLPKEGRGELRYRFAINYSTMFPPRNATSRFVLQRISMTSGVQLCTVVYLRRAVTE